MMNSYSINVKVNKLFDAYDIKLNFDNALNVLVGENGCGKTTIVKMINNIINNDFITLSKIPFESVELTIDEETKTINKDEMIPIELKFDDGKTMLMHNHPELRFIVKEALERNNDFDEFCSYVVNECQKRGYYTIEFQSNEYTNDVEKYLNDDISSIGIKNKNITKLVQEQKITRCIYGSKYYLKLIYNLYHNNELKLIQFLKVQKSFYYSFIDLDEKFYNFENISFINKQKVIRVLSKVFFRNKDIKFNQNDVVVYNNKTKKIIENTKLSSGEKKAIQFYKSLNNLKKNTMVFLDEPELSMSFFWREKMMNVLKKESSKSKVVIVSQQIHLKESEDLSLMVPMIRE